MKQQRQFEFKYQGDNFIDLNTLITSQFHFLATVNEIQKELYPEIELKLRVGAFSKGSFVVDLLMESSWKDHLFNKDNAETLSYIVGAFASLVGIHKYLKGRKADRIQESGDNVIIEVNGDRNSITVDRRVFNIYKDNTSINKAIQQNFELLNADPEIEGVEVAEADPVKGRVKLVDVPRDQFKELSTPNAYMARDTMDEVHQNQNIYIRKANLMPEKNKVWKWEFIHRGRDITAKVTDWNLAERINTGLRLGQGDRIVADIRIGYKYSDQFATFIESGSYEVVKVHDIIARSEQRSLF